MEAKSKTPKADQLRALREQKEAARQQSRDEYEALQRATKRVPLEQLRRDVEAIPARKPGELQRVRVKKARPKNKAARGRRSKQTSQPME